MDFQIHQALASPDLRLAQGAFMAKPVAGQDPDGPPVAGHHEGLDPVYLHFVEQIPHKEPHRTPARVLPK